MLILAIIGGTLLGLILLGSQPLKQDVPNRLYIKDLAKSK